MLNSTLIIPQDTKEKVTETLAETAARTHIEQLFDARRPLLMRVIGLSSWHASTRCLMTSKTWKQAVDECRRQWLRRLAHTDDSETTVQWLSENFLFGELSRLTLLLTGRVTYLAAQVNQTPRMRLQTLMTLTRAKRARWRRNHDDILSEKTMKQLLHRWRRDYRSWMSEAAQATWHARSTERTRQDKSLRFAKNRFQVFLFQMCGSYHLVLFCLRVDPSWHNLSIFHQVFQNESIYTKEEKLMMAVHAVRVMNALNTTGLTHMEPIAFATCSAEQPADVKCR